MKNAIMKTIRITYRIVTVVLVAAIVAVTLLALLLGVTGFDRQQPMSILGLRAFIVLSDSMLPTFGEGSLIIIMEAKPDTLAVGDIVTYMPIAGDDALLTHRIVSLGEDGTVTTRGDANNVDDREIEAGRILGRAIFHMDGLGTFVENLRTPFGLACMVVTIAVGLFIIPYLLKPNEAYAKKETGKIDDGEKDEVDDKDEDISEDADEDNMRNNE